MAIKLTKTESAVLGQVCRVGVLKHDVGTVRRTPHGKSYPFGSRIAKAIKQLEAKRLVSVERRKMPTQPGEFQMLLIVRPTSCEK